MKIPQQLIDEMVAHARADMPNECCGLVGGRDGEATTVYRIRNEFASPLRYRLDSQDQLRVDNEMREAGEEPVAIYHSHTRSAAYPSQTDVNEAVAWPEPMYLIVSLEDPDNPVVEGFWLRDQKIAHADLDVT
jgi:[CysO sulfur-carrier protein]-S-L-cysteine hydrolase